MPMWPYLPDLLSTPVPRYTSFPTAAEFHDGVGPGDLDVALGKVSGDVSLYVHIPFCEQICWYCGCNTGRANRKTRLTSYLDALQQEAAMIARRLPQTVRITRVAFGGGRPNAIAPTDFVRLMMTLTEAFSLREPVVSIEIDPRTFDGPWATALAGVGVTRASLGVQTFDPNAQTAIGRIQPAELIERCTRLLRGAGISSLNFDLMYGLPGQDWASLEATLAKTASLGADRIALFGYAHVPHLIPRQRQVDAAALPDQAQRFAMAALGHDWLVAEGYIPVGFDHFARPGDPMAKAAMGGSLHRNFQGFTDDAASVLIGLGASAISSFPGLLVQNEKNVGAYRSAIAADRLPAIRGISRSADDQLRGRVIEDLLCRARAALPAHLRHAAADGLHEFIIAGLAELEDDHLVVTPAGLPYARTIAAWFDPYRTAHARTFSSAV